MAPSRFLALLLLSAIVLSRSVSQGYGRRIQNLKQHEIDHISVTDEGSSVKREVLEIEMDYKEPGANTNLKNGALFNTAPPAPKPK